MSHRLVWLSVFLGVLASRVAGGEMPWVRVADDKHGFVLSTSGKPFMPWGFNYDHDENGRLLEDYWDNEWPKVEDDFREMKQLGANVVRIHLQVGKFMTDREKPNQANLERLGLLVALAEKLGVYLDVTGLGLLPQEGRARVVRPSRRRPAVGRASPVLGGGGRALCQEPRRLLLRPDERAGRAWRGQETRRLAWPTLPGRRLRLLRPIHHPGSERSSPSRHCPPVVSSAGDGDPQARPAPSGHGGVGPLEPGSPRPEFGLRAQGDCAELDFVAVHLYPEKGKIKEEMETLAGFDVGKPVIIEEMFPLKCSIPEFERFLDESRKTACGWIGFYWGKTLEECRKSNTIQDAFMIRWLEFFQKRAGEAEGAEKARR